MVVVGPWGHEGVADGAGLAGSTVCVWAVGEEPGSRGPRTPRACARKVGAVRAQKNRSTRALIHCAKVVHAGHKTLCSFPKHAYLPQVDAVRVQKNREVVYGSVGGTNALAAKRAAVEWGQQVARAMREKDTQALVALGVGPEGFRPEVLEEALRAEAEEGSDGDD